MAQISVPKVPQRDLELPMSPISHSSTLELMDCSAVLSGSARSRGDSGASREVPRVSTQKIPHRTLLESFGPPKIQVSVLSLYCYAILFRGLDSQFGFIHDFEQKQQQQKQQQQKQRQQKQRQQHVVPTLESRGLLEPNVSTTTESLFPPPAKRQKYQVGLLEGRYLERQDFCCCCCCCCYNCEYTLK